MDLNERICRYLSACPPSISGSSGHNQTFTVACALVNGFGLPEGEALNYLRLYNDRCQPPWSENELTHKITSANNAQHSKPRGHLMGNGSSFKSEDFRSTSFPAKAAPAIKKPVIDPCTAIEKFLKGERHGEADLWEASPIRPDEHSVDGVCLLGALYQPGEMINFVTEYKMTEQKDGKQKPVPKGFGQSVERNELMDAWSFEMPQSAAGGWMRMNPVDGFGVSDSNITAFRFILLEFDNIPLDLQIGLFCKLPLPIAAIITSGGKSIHAWVKVDSVDAKSYKDDVGLVLAVMAHFGIDGKNKNPGRLSRLVGVTRKLDAVGDGRQRILYLNPNPTQRPIL